jgi:hypothetical protein
MRTLLIEATAALLMTTLAITSPVLIAWAAYTVDPILGAAGLGVGMVAGPWIVFWTASLILEAVA